MRWLIVALLAGCGGPIVTACHDKGQPFTYEHPTVPFHVTMTNSRGTNSWNADGGPTVLTVHNPTDRFLELHVVCHPSVPPTYIDYGHHDWWTCMGPHQEKIRLVEFMNIDALSQVCEIDKAYASTKDTCFEKSE